MIRLPNQLYRHARLLSLIALFVGVAVESTPAAEVELSETGSTLLYPLFERWVPAYTASNPGVKFTTAATNSEKGINSVIDGTVRIGTSDAYMSDDDAARHRQIVSVPLAISAQTINYNVPGLAGDGLKLDGPILAGIYTGRIRLWDDAAIAAINPGTKLPHHDITAIRREDPSGDTFVFTQFLSFSTPSWDSAIGYGTTVAWPDVPGEQSATGNAAILRTIAATPYSIGYVGISFSDDVSKAELGTVQLKNQNGKFVLPTRETVTAAASMLDQRTPADERLSLVYAPGDQSYPLVNYEYAVVSTAQPNPETAKAIRDFLLWSIAIDGGNAASFIDAVRFIPLPDFIRALSEKQISRIR